jgi:hypothetical protein
MEENALAMLHRVAGGSIVPPRRAGSLREPLLRMLALDPAERPTMPEVRDELAKLAAGRNGDTTTVLLARTDLKSPSSGRPQTAAFPAGTSTPASPPPQTRITPTPEPAAAGAAGGAAPVPAPTGGSSTGSAVADGPAVQPAAGPPTQPGRSRRRGAWIAAGLVAVLLAGLLVFLVTDPFGGDGGSSAQESTAPTTSAAPAPSTSPPPSPTAGESTGNVDEENGNANEETVSQSSDPPPAADPLSAENVQAFLGEYHSLVLQDPQAAYALTGPTLRAAISESNYIDYWRQFQDVRLSNIQAVDGQDTATATMELVYVSGGSETSQRRFTFLVRDGELILDSDRAVG